MRAIYLFIFLTVTFGVACNNSNENKGDEGSEAVVKTALDLLNEEVEKAPFNIENLLKRGEYHIKNENYSSGVNDLESALAIDSTLIKPYILLADVAFKKNETSGTKKYLDKALSIDSLDIEANLKLAELYIYIGDFQQTIELVNVVLRQDDGLAKGYFLKGMAYKYGKNYDLAKSSFQTTVEVDPDYYNAYIQLGLLFSNEGDPLAVNYYKNALQINPNSTEAWYNLGYFLQNANDTSGAIQAYENIREIDPKHMDAIYNLGYIELVMRENTVTARNFFQEVLNLRRSHYKALYMLGRTYELEGDYERARSYFSESANANPVFQLAKDGLKRVANR